MLPLCFLTEIEGHMFAFIFHIRLLSIHDIHFGIPSSKMSVLHLFLLNFIYQVVWQVQKNLAQDTLQPL